MFIMFPATDQGETWSERFRWSPKSGRLLFVFIVSFIGIALGSCQKGGCRLHSLVVPCRSALVGTIEISSVCLCVRLSHVSDHDYLHKYSSHCFHVGTVNSPKRPSDLISVSSCSSDFLPNGGLWLVDRFLTIVSPMTHALLPYWNCEVT